MAEVQTDTQSGEVSQRFIEFVMMHAQNASLFLGQIPNPHTGQSEVNLDLAKIFIDQLAMIQEKTRGNLTKDEGTVLRNALANLQMAFVEVSQSTGSRPEAQPPASAESKAESSVAAESPEEKKSEPVIPPPPEEGESRKKFTKTYGS